MSPSIRPTAPVHRRPARTRAVQPALARPPAHERWQPELDLHDRSAGQGEFALFVGQIENDMGRMQTLPFEVWVNGADQPRGMGAVAKTLSMDMRANDKAWLKLKLDVLAKTVRRRGFDLPLPPNGEKPPRARRGLAAFANVIRYRCDKLGALEDERRQPVPTPVIDCMFRTNRKPAPTAR
jgi:hypothetical protein